MQLMELCTDHEHHNVKGRSLQHHRAVSVRVIFTAIDYTFGLFTGILLASSFYFIIYAVYKQNKPSVYPKVILPGLVSGVMWGIATSTVFINNNMYVCIFLLCVFTAGWIIANAELSMTVSYPLVSSVSDVCCDVTSYNAVVFVFIATK